MSNIAQFWSKYKQKVVKKNTKWCKNVQKSVLYKHISSAALHAAEIPYRHVNMSKGARKRNQRLKCKMQKYR
jgi:hypothetical protein